MKGRHWSGLLLGVLVVSSAALLIREAQAAGAGGVAIASGRLGIAAACLVPLVAWKAGRGAAAHPLDLTLRDVGIAVGAGILLALHFVAWISSLALTSVASSVALVTTNPIWVALGAWALLGERPPVRQWMGIGLAFAGALVILAGDGLTGGGPSLVATNQSATALRGDALAVAGAVTISGYLLIGRGLARRLPMLTYLFLVYGAAAVVLLTWAVVIGQAPWALPQSAIPWVVLLALGPQLLGHTAINLALRQLSPGFVALAILGEPIGSALLAWAIYGEQIGIWQTIGFVFLVAGIAVAARAEAQTGVTGVTGVTGLTAPEQRADRPAEKRADRPSRLE